MKVLQEQNKGKKCFHLRNLKTPHRENSLIKDKNGENSQETEIFLSVAYSYQSKIFFACFPDVPTYFPKEKIVSSNLMNCSSTDSHNTQKLSKALTLFTHCLEAWIII